MSDSKDERSSAKKSPGVFSRMRRGASFFVFGPDKVAGVDRIKTSESVGQQSKKTKGNISSRVEYWKNEIQTDRKRLRIGEAARRESFNDAMNRHNHTEESLKVVEAALSRRYYVWGVFFHIAVLFSVFNFLFKPELVTLLNLSMPILMFIFRFRSAFRYTQVQKRELFGVSQFLKMGGLKKVLWYV